LSGSCAPEADGGGGDGGWSWGTFTLSVVQGESWLGDLLRAPN